MARLIVIPCTTRTTSGNFVSPLLDEYGHVAVPVAYFNGKLVGFHVTDSKKPRHSFGGPLPMIKNQPPQASLNLVLSIDLVCLGLNSPMSPMPFIYPFGHDGGKLHYACRSNAVVDIRNCRPKESTADWPYPDFPEQIPKRGLRATTPKSTTLEEFEDNYAQDSFADPNQVVVLVPPSKTYGVSLWGEHGDSAGVLCVFVVDPSTWEVTSFNVCG